MADLLAMWPAVGRPEPPTLRFGPFQLQRAQRRLLEAGAPVRMGGRSFDLLVALVERAGEVVGKAELLASAWPGESVEDNTLRVHIAVLRKALGDGRDGVRYITNVPGRGYCFVAEVRRDHGPALAEPFATPEAGTGPGKPSTLPAPITRLLGREAQTELLAHQVREQRFVTLVGPGGIGKTSLALAVAHGLQDSFEHGCHFVDLANAEPDTLLGAFTASLGLSQANAQPLEALFGFLQHQRLLLVLDNCEHLLQPLAAMLARCSARCPGVHHLATSREPLRVDGERVVWLGPLALPAADAASGAADPLASPAVQLFVERATASDDRFALNEADADVVVQLCRQLDGSPLAIEIAAAQVGAYGLRGLAKHLGAEPLDLLELPHRRRTVASRHHTLGAMLDWSYRLLNDAERCLLRGLSVFEGALPLDAAEAMAAAQGLDASQRLAAMAGLVARSLVSPDHSVEPVLFRLHGSTRQYGRQRLEEAQEGAALRLAHTRHLQAQLRRARDDWPLLPAAAWNQRHGWMVNDLHAAIQRGLADESQRSVSIAMLNDASMFAVRLFRLSDLQTLVAQAVVALPRGEADAAAEVQLKEVLRAVMQLQAGPKLWAEESSSAQASVDALMETVMKAFTVAFMSGAHQTMLNHAERLATLARDAGDPVAITVADRMRAQGEHFMGRHGRARLLAERVLKHPVRRGHFGAASGTVDHQVSMRILLARTLWLEGQPDEAAALVEELMVHAHKDTPQALSQSLVMAAIPVALWRGDLERARAFAGQLRQVLEPHAFRAMYEAWPDAIEALPSTWSPRLAPSRAPTEAATGPGDAFLLDHLVSFHASHANEEALRRVSQGMVGWCAPEVQRAYAETLLAAPPEALRETLAEAQDFLQRALLQAQAQGARAWVLRVAISQCRLDVLQGRAGQGHGLLETALNGISGGQQTADVLQARRCLDAPALRLVPNARRAAR